MAAAQELIGSIKLTSTQTAVIFANIPQNYRDLKLVLNGTITGTGGHTMQLNGDAGANYNSVTVYGDGIGTNTGSYTAVNATTGIGISYFWDTAVSTSTCNLFGYSQTDRHKSFIARSGGGNYNHIFAGRWASNAAVNSIKLTCSGTNFDVGSTFYLYGVLA